MVNVEWNNWAIKVHKNKCPLYEMTLAVNCPMMDFLRLLHPEDFCDWRNRQISCVEIKNFVLFDSWLPLYQITWEKKIRTVLSFTNFITFLTSVLFYKDIWFITQKILFHNIHNIFVFSWHKNIMQHFVSKKNLVGY